MITLSSITLILKVFFTRDGGIMLTLASLLLTAHTDYLAVSAWS